MYVLLVIAADDRSICRDDGGPVNRAPAVFGLADSALVIERISGDAELLFGVRVSEILGASLLRLVVAADADLCAEAAAEASRDQRGVTVTVRIRVDARVRVGPLQCEMLILPLRPAPSLSFIFLPLSSGVSLVSASSELSVSLSRLGREAEVVALAHGVLAGLADRDLPGISHLTTREREITSRLLEGDRPPMIATSLSLSQSTVRNHLASAFIKLGVTSQQGLVDLFRAARGSR
ncbi:MAG: Response regulator containing a CheY-like receiver domain and an DNA-binding domain [Jatrophihabitans sp.]|nr:Response regulator containing a CheY-like receiver domain and an DNA-binding domain [Jatrophihabitans sp.]